MKKLLSVLLVITLVLGLSACGGEPEKKEITDKAKNNTQVKSNTIDDVTYEITSARIEPAQGDRNADSTVNTGGEYIMVDGEIVKAVDYKNVVIVYTITNAKDAAIGYSTLNWNVHLQDGYKLERRADMSEMGLKQIPSGSAQEITLIYPIKADVKVAELVLEYKHLDYNEEYWKDFGKIITGEMTEEEYMNKYDKKAELLKFTVKVEQ